MDQDFSVRIRTGTVEDLPAILELYRELDKELVALQPEFFCLAPRDSAFYKKALQDPDYAFLLAEVEGTPAGFALVHNSGWTPEFSASLPHRYAELYDLVVAEPYRRGGIGSLLVGRAKRWARDRRLEYIELHVLAQNSDALRLYEAHDFVEASRTLRCML